MSASFLLSSSLLPDMVDSLSVGPHCWIKLPVTVVHRRRKSRLTNQRFRSAALSPGLRASLRSPTDLLSDLLLLRVPGELLRAPGLCVCVCLRLWTRKLLTVSEPTQLIDDAAFLKCAVSKVVRLWWSAGLTHYLFIKTPTQTHTHTPLNPWAIYLHCKYIISTIQTVKSHYLSCCLFALWKK